MSNLIKTNPMVLDTTGTIMTGELHIQGVTVVPSGTSWSVVLTDLADNTVYQMSKASIDGHADFFSPVLITGLKYVTGTNVTKILVHKRNS